MRPSKFIDYDYENLLSEQEVSRLGLFVPDWDRELYEYIEPRTIGVLRYIANEPFNFRRAPFSVIQRGCVKPEIREEYLQLACAAGKLNWWESIRPTWHGNASPCIEHCFSRFCIITDTRHRQAVNPIPKTPNYERGDFGSGYFGEFTPTERFLDAGDSWECEPDRYFFVVEWRGLYYYADNHVRSRSHLFPGFGFVPEMHAIPPALCAKNIRSKVPAKPLCALSRVIYWPCPGLDLVRLRNCVREELNKSTRTPAQLLKAAAMFGVTVNERVAKRSKK